MCTTFCTVCTIFDLLCIDSIFGPVYISTVKNLTFESWPLTPLIRHNRFKPTFSVNVSFVEGEKTFFFSQQTLQSWTRGLTNTVGCSVKGSGPDGVGTWVSVSTWTSRLIWVTNVRTWTGVNTTTGKRLNVNTRSSEVRGQGSCGPLKSVWQDGLWCGISVTAARRQPTRSRTRREQLLLSSACVCVCVLPPRLGQSTQPEYCEKMKYPSFFKKNVSPTGGGGGWGGGGGDGGVNCPKLEQLYNDTNVWNVWTWPFWPVVSPRNKEWISPPGFRQKTTRREKN